MKRAGFSLAWTTVAFAAGLLAAPATIAAPAGPAGPQCLQTYQIDHTNVVNDHTILFVMKDHTTWRNDLNTPCVGLSFGGFSYVAEPTDEICGNVQVIRSLQSHSVCKLGPFLPSPPAR